MDQIFYHLSLFSLISSTSGIILAVLLFLRNKNKLILLYIFIVLTTSIFLFCKILVFYLYNMNNIKVYYIYYIIYTIYQTSLAVFSLLFPIFVYKILKTYLNKIKKTIIITIALIELFPAVAFIIKRNEYQIYFQMINTVQTILILALLFYIAFSVKNKIKHININEIKKTLKFMFYLQIFFYPLFACEFIFYRLPIDLFKKIVPYYSVSVFSIFFLLINLTWLFFVSNFLYFPEIIIDKDNSINIFSNIYSITNRESEIIEFLLEGYSYKKISEKLFISFDTVKTHIKNIYRKSNVKNKMELSKLIKKCNK